MVIPVKGDIRPYSDWSKQQKPTWNYFFKILLLGNEKWIFIMKVCNWVVVFVIIIFNRRLIMIN